MIYASCQQKNNNFIRFDDIMIHKKFDSYPTKKKSLGQHFLRKISVVDNMIARVVLSPQISVLEIGCGDGFLTKAIIEKSACKQLWSYEIDSSWANFVSKKISNSRLKVKNKNILEVDFDAELASEGSWVVLANLPYQITFPILFLLKKYKHLFTEGVVMVQEEVAQKIVATYGRSYNPTSIIMQHNFTWELMEKIEPEAFDPAPKVNSRLLYFKPKQNIAALPDEEQFWKFLKSCFKTPRQMLRNNLKTTHYAWSSLPESTLQLRAQQMTFDDFLHIWNLLRGM